MNNALQPGWKSPKLITDQIFTMGEKLVISDDYSELGGSSWQMDLSVQSH